MVELSRWFTFFIVYSFLGWVWETSFVSVRTRKFINRGFLKGPFIPIYGCGALLIILIESIIAHPTGNNIIDLFVVVLISTVVVTLLEFLTGYAMEKIFNRKWWDYSERRWNIKGYICLEYSLGWGLFILAFLLFIHPNIYFYLSNITSESIITIATLFSIYLLIDLMLSIKDVISIREIIIKYSEIPLEIYRMKIIKYRRILIAFPNLQKLNEGITNFEVRRILNDRVKKFKTQIESKLRRHPRI